MSQEFQHIVRILGNDIPGEKNLLTGLTQIRGVGYMFARAILEDLNVASNNNIGDLTEDQVKLIEKILQNPTESGFPQWFLNRRRDVETGNDLHLITSDIEFTVRNDVERERITGSWRGYRHMFGLKVRGQRTRCTGRRGGAVGVAKGGKVMPQKSSGPAAPAAPGAPATEASDKPKEEAKE